MTGFYLLQRQSALNHHLGHRDPGVVGADLPQGVFTPAYAGNGSGIHDGLLESMSHMQTAGDVRRRIGDAERLFCFRRR